MRGQLKEIAVVALVAAVAVYLARLPLLSDGLAIALGALGAVVLPLFLLHRERKNCTHRTQRYIQRLIDRLPDPVYLTDSQNRYLMVNEAFNKEQGCSPESIIGKALGQLESQPEIVSESMREDESVISGKDIHQEQCISHPRTGEEYFRIVSKQRVEDEWGAFVIVGAHFNITLLRQTERELHAVLEREKNHRERVLQFVQRLLDVIPMPVYVKDSQSRYMIVNTAQAREWGRPIAELVGVNSLSLAPTEEVAARIKNEDASVISGKSVYKEEQNLHPITGKDRFRVVTKGCCLDTEGEAVIVCTLFDTTQWRVAERDLQSALNRETALRERTQDFIQRVIDVIPDPFYIKDAEARFLMVNDALASERRIPKAEMVGLYSYSLAADQAMVDETIREDLEIIAGKEISKEQHYIVPGTGEERFRQIIKRRCINVDGTPVIVVAHFNITRWKVAERELERNAHEDLLTGIANRRFFLAEAERTISRADRHGESLSLLIFDLDHFKHVNDEHGHQAGDEVLREVVQRACETLRSDDLPGRWGGEEFVVLLPLTDTNEALLVANRLCASIASSPINTCAGPLSITASCGFAQRTLSESIDALIARADAALYQAKRGGRNRCVAASQTTSAENASVPSLDNS